MYQSRIFISGCKVRTEIGKEVLEYLLPESCNCHRFPLLHPFYLQPCLQHLCHFIFPAHEITGNDMLPCLLYQP